MGGRRAATAAGQGGKQPPAPPRAPCPLSRQARPNLGSQGGGGGGGALGPRLRFAGSASALVWALARTCAGALLPAEGPGSLAQQQGCSSRQEQGPAAKPWCHGGARAVAGVTPLPCTMCSAPPDCNSGCLGCRAGPPGAPPARHWILLLRVASCPPSPDPSLVCRLLLAQRHCPLASPGGQGLDRQAGGGRGGPGSRSAGTAWRWERRGKTTPSRPRACWTASCARSRGGPQPRQPAGWCSATPPAPGPFKCGGERPGGTVALPPPAGAACSPGRSWTCWPGSPRPGGSVSCTAPSRHTTKPLLA